MGMHDARHCGSLAGRKSDDAAQPVPVADEGKILGASQEWPGGKICARDQEWESCRPEKFPRANQE